MKRKPLKLERILFKALIRLFSDYFCFGFVTLLKVIYANHLDFILFSVLLSVQRIIVTTGFDACYI